MAYDFSDPHLSELKNSFPETPDSIILKADVLREGLRYTKELSEIGQWAIPGSAFLSRETTPAEEAPDDGTIAIPNQMVLADDTRINTELDHSSPYMIRKTGENAYAICRDDQAIADVSFLRRPQFKQVLSDGTPVEETLGQRAEICVALVHTAFCEYARNDDQCAFCILGNRMAGRKLNDLPGPKKNIEACALASREIDIRHVVVSGGAFINTALEAKSYARTISAIREAVGPEARVTAVCQAFDETGWRLLKEAGASRVQPNLEVWEESLWETIVPGKARNIGKAEWIERLKSAVDVFGVGDVATNFVAGSELVSDTAFSSSEDVLASHLEGYTFLLKHDIVPVFGFLTKARGTRYHTMALPPTEFYLRLGWERTMLMKESGMFGNYSGGIDADFSCYKCVTHKTCQDYPRLMGLSGSDTR